MNLIEYIASDKENLGIHQYAFLKTSDMVYSDETRELCKANYCGNYGKSWACPPGSGTLEECRALINRFENMLVFTTMHILEDSYDIEGMAEGGKKHGQVCAALADLFRPHYPDMLVLSAGGCHRCDTCTYPDAPCRFPDKLVPSVSSFGIHVSKLAANAHINYINGANTVTYFSFLIY